MTAHVSPQQIAAAKLQHHVIYVDDLAQSKDFYMKLFDLQFSALNHPDSSAAMRTLSSGNALLQLRILSSRHLRREASQAEDGQRLDAAFLLVARDAAAFDGIRRRANEMGVPTREGRMIASAKAASGQRTFCVQDPDRHWVEIIEETQR